MAKTYEVLIEGESKKDKNQWKGRTSQNAVVVFDKVEGQNIGDFVTVFVHDSTQGTLLGKRFKEMLKFSKFFKNTKPQISKL